MPVRARSLELNEIRFKKKNNLFLQKTDETNEMRQNIEIKRTHKRNKKRIFYALKMNQKERVVSGVCMLCLMCNGAALHLPKT